MPHNPSHFKWAVIASCSTTFAAMNRSVDSPISSGHRKPYNTVRLFGESRAILIPKACAQHQSVCDNPVPGTAKTKAVPGINRLHTHQDITHSITLLFTAGGGGMVFQQKGLHLRHAIKTFWSPFSPALLLGKFSVASVRPARALSKASTF